MTFLKNSSKSLNTLIQACLVNQVGMCLMIHSHITRIFYLATITEIVTLFKEQFSNSIIESFSSPATVMIKNAVCFGGESWRVSFESIETTSSMVGLSVAWSCTHTRPTWIHLNTSNIGHDSSSIARSISSRPLPSFHNCHAWYKQLYTQH